MPAKSRIFAVDVEMQSLSPNVNGVDIEFHQADFIREELPFTVLDGIMLANSLHYVSDQTALIGRLKKILKKDSGFVVVEYDSSTANRWVPYPLPFKDIHHVFEPQGFNTFRKIGSKPSLYRRADIYACLVQTV